MPAKTTTKRGKAADRNLISTKQDYEVAYEAKKMKVSKAAVKKAVKKVGHSRKKVEAELKAKKKK